VANLNTELVRLSRTASRHLPKHDSREVAQHQNVVIPLYDGVGFIGALNELVCWSSEIAQTLDAIPGSQFRALASWRDPSQELTGKGSGKSQTES
jgi:hypothetical protein